MNNQTADSARSETLLGLRQGDRASLRASVELFNDAMILVAAALIAVPTFALAQPAPGSISPNHDTGQQVGDDGLECDEGGTAPSQSGREPGPGSPFQEDSVSGSHYAGEQDGINNKNTAAVSQYDIACFEGSEVY